MKLLLVAVVVVALLQVTVALNAEQLDELWQSFKTTHNKQYADDIEEGYRRQVFAVNVESVTLHNIEADLGQHSFTLGINEYSDLTLEEYKKTLLGARVPADYEHNITDAHNFKYDLSYFPDTVDWRDKGYVTPVKNQGQCGSCWSFSSTGAMEGQHFRKTKTLPDLSEQNLVDCSKAYGNYGCGGGWMINAFKYVTANRGIDTEKSYPYEAKDNVCRFQRSTVGATCIGYRSIVPAGDESALMAAVATVGPIAVAIDANHNSFSQYKSGVYNEVTCSKSVDHAVLVVGYGTYQGLPYWLVKNSWGTSWGMNGYVMMSRNKNNQCGIASYGCYPLM
jgi:cathepsin L